jgi:aminopeptidase N
MAEEITEGMFPTVAVSPETRALADAALAKAAVDGQRRLLVEGRADLERAMRARAADPK